MTVINHLTLPEYYYLYALYFDYPLNNQFHLGIEDRKRMRGLLRFIAPLIGLRQSYRKSFALRLFTERQSLERFPPERVDEALRQLKQAVMELRPRVAEQAPELHGRAKADAARNASRVLTSAADPMPDPWPGIEAPPPPVRYLLRA